VVETSALVLKIDNQAYQVAKAAVADGDLIKATAVYEAKRKVDQAQSDGLKYMLAQAGLETDEHKASLDYITSLINNKASVTPYINMGSTNLLKKNI